MKKNKKITFRLDDQLHEFLNRVAGLDDCSLSSVVRLLLLHNVRAFHELKELTNPEVAGWLLRQQAAMAVDV